MPSAFVTGGTGFVGSHLVEHLLARGYDDVRCLVRREAKWLEGLPVTFVRGSLSTPADLEAAVRDVDDVFHVAGLTRSLEWNDFVEANVTGTTNLLDLLAARPAPPRRVVITSSLAATGDIGSPVADETSPLNPISMYGRSKAEMEAAIVPYHDRLPIVTIRPPAVYGPRETDILTFFRSVSRGLCPIVGRGDVPALSLVHVSDLVRGMVDAAEAASTVSRTYFIGSTRAYSWNEIRDAAVRALSRRVLTIRISPALVTPIGAVSEAVGRLLGTYPPLNREKAREIRRTCTMCSSDRARQDFGYESQISLEDGVAETIAWYREQNWL